MEMNSLNFTKLGTVKYDESEYTYDDFFQLMQRNITRDVDNNRVYFDIKRNHYIIKILSNSYQVKYGNELINKLSDKKEIITILDKLIELSKKSIEYQKKQEKIVKENELKQQQEVKKNEVAIENGEKGIFNTEEDKKRYISHLKKELSNCKFEFPSLFKIHKSIVDKIWDNIIFKILVGFNFIGGGLLGLWGMLSFAYTIDLKYVILMLSGGAISFQMPLHIALVLSIIISYPFVSLVKAIKTHSKKDKIKTKIKALKESLSKSISKEDNNMFDELAKEAEKAEVNQIEKENSIPEHRAVEEILKEFNVLKNKIVLIQDEKQKNTYIEQLRKLVDYYEEVSITFSEKGNMLTVHRQVLEQVIVMSFEVEKLLKEEEKKQQQADEFDRMLDEANRVSAMGSRK